VTLFQLSPPFHFTFTSLVFTNINTTMKMK